MQSNRFTAHITAVNWIFFTTEIPTLRQGIRSRFERFSERPNVTTRRQHSPMIEYRLVAGVLGIIFDEDSEAEAKRQFDLFVRKSKTARSAAAGTSVTFFKNGEIIAEYHPPDRV